MASTEMAQQVKAVLAPFDLARLTPDSAAALRDALCRAGLWQQPQIDAALQQHGLSVKQLEALAPVAATRPTPDSGAQQAGGRPKVPRRE